MVNRRATLSLIALAGALLMPLAMLVNSASAVAGEDALRVTPDRPALPDWITPRDRPTPERIEPDAPRDLGFATLKLTIDPKGQRLAAYQVEIRVDDSGSAGTAVTNAATGFKVVGLEKADDDAFNRVPYYDLDTRTTTTDRLILAQYSTADRDQLPDATFTLATAHLALVGTTDTSDTAELPRLRVTVTAAYDEAGKPIEVDASYELTQPTRPGDGE